MTPERERAHDCVANMDVFAHIAPPTIDVGMLLYVHKTGAMFENGYPCVQGHGQGGGADTVRALYFADLDN